MYKRIKENSRFAGLILLCTLIFFGNACSDAEYRSQTDLAEKPEYSAESEMAGTDSSENTAADDYTETKEDEFKIDYYIDSESFKYTYVYDSDYLNLLLDYDDVSTEEVFLAVDNNDLIPDNFKPIVKQYYTDLVTRQPEAERRVLYENLKTLEIRCLDQHELAVATWSNYSSGGYDRNKNIIHVLENLDFTKGEWGYQVIYHELSHAARTAVWDKDNFKRRVQCEGLGFNTLMSAEALNSLFAVSLLDYEEDEISYQLQSNYFKVMIDSLENYQLHDYMNHSLSWFVSELGEHNGGDKKRAAGILKLIDEQYKDLYSGREDTPQNKYYPIYDYISSTYYKNRITEDMSYEEACKVADSLVYQIVRNVEPEYRVDVNHFYTYFKDYYDQLKS